MTYDKINPAIRAAIGCREGFRKMGFAADDLFVELARDAAAPGLPLTLFVKLSAQGKVFRVGVARWVGSTAALEREWMRTCAAVNSGAVSEADLDRIWQESLPYQDKAGFAIAIVAKGLIPPRSL